MDSECCDAVVNVEALKSSVVRFAPVLFLSDVQFTAEAAAFGRPRRGERR
jgi:hypothetical protein